jgi:hypothetical protein
VVVICRKHALLHRHVGHAALDHCLGNAHVGPVALGLHGHRAHAENGVFRLDPGVVDAREEHEPRAAAGTSVDLEEAVAAVTRVVLGVKAAHAVVAHLLEEARSRGGHLLVWLGDNGDGVANGAGVVVLEAHVAADRKDRVGVLVDVAVEGVHVGVTTRHKLLHDEAVVVAGVLERRVDPAQLLRCLDDEDLLLALELRVVVVGRVGRLGHQRVGEALIVGNSALERAVEEARLGVGHAHLLAHLVEVLLLRDKVEYVKVHDWGVVPPLELWLVLRDDTRVEVAAGHEEGHPPLDAELVAHALEQRDEDLLGVDALLHVVVRKLGARDGLDVRTRVDDRANVVGLPEGADIRVAGIVCPQDDRLNLLGKLVTICDLGPLRHAWVTSGSAYLRRASSSPASSLRVMPYFSATTSMW